MTTTILLSSILIPPNRQRREFNEAAMQELVVSISETPYGLQHPIVVRQTEGGAELVAGERRLRAIKQIYDLGGTFRHAGSVVPVGEVPVVDLGELDPVDAFEAELEENIRRCDLSMLENAKATARLFELRAAQAARDGRPAPTTGDLAREIFDLPPDKSSATLGSFRDTVKSQLMVAKHANLPGVAKAPTLKEAVKIIKAEEARKANAVLAEAVGKTFSANLHSLIHGEALEEIDKLSPGQFEIILTDPPYGIGAHLFNDSGQGVDAAAHFYEDSYETWRDLMLSLPHALWRVAAEKAHAYLFCDSDRFAELSSRMGAAGWQVFRTPLIWHNPDGFRAPWPKHGPQRKYEMILYAIKGGRECNRLEGDVLTYAKDVATGHPAQKPVPLLLDLLRRSARPGDRVLDPFAGSGSTLVAAHQLTLPCTAIEVDQAAYGLMVKRFKGLTTEEALF